MKSKEITGNWLISKEYVCSYLSIKAHKFTATCNLLKIEPKIVGGVNLYRREDIDIILERLLTDWLRMQKKAFNFSDMHQDAMLTSYYDYQEILSGIFHNVDEGDFERAYERAYVRLAQVQSIRTDHFSNGVIDQNISFKDLTDYHSN